MAGRSSAALARAITVRSCRGRDALDVALTNTGAGHNSGVAREPIRMELRLVYTIDEFPFRGRELAAPTTVTMFENARAWAALPRCVLR